MSTFSTADLCDSQPDTYDSCELQLRSFGRSSNFYGPVVTVLCPNDNGLIRVILAGPGEGQVLVVDGGASLQTALVGDVLVSLALSRGWAGIVVNGAVRDTAALAVMPFGLKALGTSPRRAAQGGSGLRDVPVTFGGATFVTGSLLYSDPDGVLVTRGGPDESTVKHAPSRVTSALNG